MKNHSATADTSETKRKLLDASVKLMRSKGFNATTVDDICVAAGVTKGGFFHYFQGKQDIARAAVERFREIRRQTFASAPFSQLTDPLDRIFGRLTFVQEELKMTLRSTGGCLIGMFAQELSITNPELRSACHDSFTRLAQELEKDFTAAKSLYAPQASFEPRHLATLFVAVYQGSVLMAKTSDANHLLEDNFTQFAQLLTVLFGRQTSPAAVPITPIADQSRN